MEPSINQQQTIHTDPTQATLMSLAASYYLLYHQEDQKNEEFVERGMEGGGSQVEEGENEYEVWKEDVWTEDDEQAALERLQQSRERCLVVSSSSKNTKEDTAWDRFYESHQTNFFKDRHYLATAFPTEFGSAGESERSLVELGCGVGNALLPLLEGKEGGTCWTVYGLDLSEVAINLLQQDARFQAAALKGRAFAAVHNLGSLSDPLPTMVRGVASVTSLLFCLSAVDPDIQQETAALKAAETLQPGGVLVFRDYGRYDEAQMKLASQRNKLVKDNFYRKHDGTCCYYFTTSDLEELFVRKAGLEVLELGYLRRVYQNRSDDSVRRRVWVQARFRKPFPP